MRILLTVFRRELHRMNACRIYGVACIVLPLFSLVFMATIFGNGRLENLPVGVVDADNTSASRDIIRLVEAVPVLHVVKHYADEAEARKDVQRKRIYGYLLIPTGFAEKVGNNQPTTLVYYYHNAMLGVGGELRSAFERLLKQLSVQPLATQAIAMGETSSDVSAFLMPITEEEAPAYNLNRNYAVYLSQPFFFVLLQVLLLLVTVYALGSESKFGTSDEWLQTAGGNILIAVTGKLLPYTFIYMGMGILANFVFYGWMQIPLPCSLWGMNGVVCLFVLATQALALFLYSVFPVMSLIISVVSMVGSLGATLSGVTFPVAFMDMPVFVASHLFPIRHFMEAEQTLLYLHGTFTDVWMDVAFLLLFLLPPLCLLPRLKKKLVMRKNKLHQLCHPEH